MTDNVNHPKHYTSSKAKCSACGHQIEAIDVTEHMSFSIGNAVKYLWRAGLKNDAIEDLKKAKWYITREIETREKEQYNEIIKEQTEGMAQTSTGTECCGTCSGKQCSTRTQSAAPKSYDLSTDAAYITPYSGRLTGSERDYPRFQPGKGISPTENRTIEITSGIYGTNYDPFRWPTIDTITSIGYSGCGTGDTMNTQSGGTVNLTTTAPVVYTMNHGTQWNGALASGWDLTFGKGL